MNLAVWDGLAVQEVQTALARAKKIVTHFHKSRLDSEVLKDKQKQLNLPQHELIQVTHLAISMYVQYVTVKSLHFVFLCNCKTIVMFSFFNYKKTIALTQAFLWITITQSFLFRF